MSDELEQLLLHADATAPAPTIEANKLSHRVRRTARNQRRLAACGLASLALLACIPFWTSRAPSPVVNAIPESPVSVADLQLKIELHERTAALLEASERRPEATTATDSFLADLHLQRNRAALMLLKDANRKLDARDELAATAALRRTIRLFPETTAATTATKQLDQLDSKREL